METATVRLSLKTTWLKCSGKSLRLLANRGRTCSSHSQSDTEAFYGRLANARKLLNGLSTLPTEMTQKKQLQHGG